MANKRIQITDGTDNLYPMPYSEDITVTTGSSTYSGYYYADGTVKSGVKGLSVVNATSNRPAFVILISSTSFRAYCPVSGTAVTVRVLY